MFEFLAGVFGYLLALLYDIVNNYGIAIILFSVIIKLLLLPLSIKQQRTMKKTAELQDKMKVLQFKYKNDPEKMNQELMNMYKDEKMSPFSGCLTAIIQLLLLISVFYLVRSPITFMQKTDNEEKEKINTYMQQLIDDGKTVSAAYPEIDLIREYNFLKEKNPDDATVEILNIKMDFLGLDLSKIPQQNMTDYTVYIIPVLYIISSFISIQLTTKMQQKQMQGKSGSLIDGTTGKDLVEKKDDNELDSVMQTNKMMSWMMPIMSISIAFIAPLGLALYWFINNILMILERIVLDKLLNKDLKEE